MAKVLLVLCNSMMDNLIPLGVSLLSACLKKAGHEVRLFDTTFYRTRERTGDDVRVETLQVAKTNLEDYGIRYKENKAEDDFRKMIEEYKPDLIGVSVVEITYKIGLNLLNAIKDIKIPKVMGGIHTTLAPEEVIKEDCVDMICIGEGEEALIELIDRIDKKQDYSDVKNLWVKKDGEITRNELRPLADLDGLPFQDWSIYEPERFFKPMGGKVYVMGNIEMNRSCMHKCTYCANAALHKLYEGKGRYYREKSMELVMKELKYLKEKYNLQYVYFIAENFLAINNERLRKFSELYKGIGVPFYIDTRVDTITPEKIKVLAELRCEGIALGIESGDPEFREKMLNRFMSNEYIIKAIDIIKENSNIRVSVNNIIGFPTETREQIFKTIELNRNVDSDYVMVNIFNPYHGTKLREIAIQKGYMEPEEIAGDYRSDYILNMPHLPKDELKGLRKTFSMYVKFPKEMWPQIKIAEKFDEEGNAMFEKLSKIYLEKYM